MFISGLIEDGADEKDIVYLNFGTESGLLAGSASELLKIVCGKTAPGPG